jgi:hypothetical protein
MNRRVIVIAAGGVGAPAGGCDPRFLEQPG